MSNHPDLDTLAHEIVRRHSPLALQAQPLERLPICLAALPTAIVDPIGWAVYVACRALDFIDADALCVANAWQRQSARTGQFDPSAWPTDPQDFGWPTSSLRGAMVGSTSVDHGGLKSAPQQFNRTGPGGFPPCPQHLGLYAVLPDAAWVGRMARAGVPTVQLRFKSDDPAAVTREVQAAVQAVQGTGALLFVNDHWQAAIAAGAYGVHLGQEDLEGLGGADLDAIRTAGLRLGVSSHGYSEMLRAAAVQPSYIAMGAVYATTLKRMATPPQGPARLKLYATLLRDLPTVAIGGIDAARLPEVLASGVGSVAVVRALVAAEQPEAEVAALQAMFARQA
jgi:thiamine-phosphate pyrophosphorylase